MLDFKRRTLGILLICISMAACGDDDDDVGDVDADLIPQSDAATADPVDAGNSTVDAAPSAPDAALFIMSIYGSECESSATCGIGGYCLADAPGDGWPAPGYCVKECIADPECRGGAFCAPAQAPNPDTGLCFAECMAGSTCFNPKHACVTSANGGRTVLDRPGCLPATPGAAEGTPCMSFGDCDPSQQCDSNECTTP